MHQHKQELWVSLYIADQGTKLETGGIVNQAEAESFKAKKIQERLECDSEPCRASKSNKMEQPHMPTGLNCLMSLRASVLWWNVEHRERGELSWILRNSRRSEGLEFKWLIWEKLIKTTKVLAREWFWGGRVPISFMWRQLSTFRSWRKRFKRS